MEAGGLAVTSQGQRPSLRKPDSLPVYCLFSAVLMLLAVGFPARGLSINFPEFRLLITFGALLICAAWIAKLRNFGRIATAIEAWTVLLLSGLSFVLVGILLATGHAPFADPLFAAADRTLFPGFEWRSTVIALSHQTSLLMPVANFAYESILWQPTVLIVLYAAMNLKRECWSFVFAWTTTIALAMAVFAILPGLGAYHFYGISAADVPGVHTAVGWRQPEIIQNLRAARLTTIGLDSLEGLVTFPSFHAAAAVLLTRYFWFNRWTRWPFAALNISMFLSTVPMGGHYYVDLPAGIVAAVAGLWITQLCFPASSPRWSVNAAKPSPSNA